MRYTEFRDLIRNGLNGQATGLTWAQLRDGLSLPYVRACPEWTKRLESEIGLVREKGAGRALVWTLQPPKKEPGA